MADKDNVVKAVQTGAPLVGAPAEFIGGGVREITYKLKYPFRLEGVDYLELTAHKMTGRDIFAINRAGKQAASNPSNADPEIMAYAVMCRVGPRVIESMDAEDIRGLGEATADFTRRLSPEAPEEPTGENGENT